MSVRGLEKQAPFIRAIALTLSVLLAGSGDAMLFAQDPAAQGAPAEPAAEKLPPDQLDSLVAPIALYPDPLLAQTLVAATYPLELIQLQQWLVKNKDLKDKALADAVAKQPWDPAIQSMAAIPDVVKRLADDIQWTTQLGDAFLDQQDDVMDAVQRMRKKAEEKGSLTSNEQQKVETKVVESKTVIVVQPTNPEVIYVPSYNPTVVYPPPIYPYPPVYYPPYYPGTALVSFGVGMAMGAAIWGGSCCGCSWGGGGNNININNNNNFNRNTNINRGGNNNWQHNSQHRGGAPYSNKATANKYGGSTRGGTGSGSTRQASSRAGGASNMSANRGAAGGASANRGSSGGGDRVGNRSVPSSSKGSGAFSGASGSRSSANRASASSSRGASSMGSRGGGSRGGGGGRRR